MSERSSTDHPKVHFTEEDDSFGRDNNVVVLPGDDGKILNVHLGFLQINHLYELQLSVSKSVVYEGPAVDLVIADGIIPNINCKVVGMQQDAEKIDFSIHFLAHKEKLLKEKLQFKTSSGVPVAMVLQARVLGKGKGTPLLKTGIRIIGRNEEDESEASDWTGFE